jgi:glycosyltransferase involved in cell wall biosynthesis
MSPQPVAISVLIPAHNEAGNLPPLMEKIARTFAANQLHGEVVLVNDGSTDNTRAEADALAAQYSFLRAIHHRRNRGLTEALKTGFRAVCGDVIIFLPADLESDPEEDVPKLLAKMNEGYDIVSGWRQGRRDRKILASGVYNFVSRHLFGVAAHDMNWIKAFTREVMEDLHLRSDWHRFILMIAAAHGYRIGEVEVNFYPRKRGKSKFGFWRIPVSFLDALVVKFLLTFSRKPMLFFGACGLIFILVGLAILAYLAYLFFAFDTQQRPVFIFGIFLVVSGLLLFLVGFLAELIVAQIERLEEK